MASQKPISLSVHKNNRARRHAKEMRDDIAIGVESAQRHFRTDWRGFVLVMWNSDGDTLSNWDGLDALGACPLDEFARIAIRRKNINQVVVDTLNPDDEGA